MLYPQLVENDEKVGKKRVPTFREISSILMIHDLLDG
jgi:hypothetical protein